mgnify:CR=1 FL=1
MPIGFTGAVFRMASMRKDVYPWPSSSQWRCSCGALIVCIIAGISIIPALLAGVVIFLAHGRLTGHTFTAMISKGFATMRAASIVVVTFVLIGLLTTLWRAAGTVSFIVTNTAGLVHPHVMVLLTFLLNCLMSLLTGSSFASAATMGVITMTLGASMQVPPVFLGGAILSGIYFGDRCSPYPPAPNWSKR